MSERNWGIERALMGVLLGAFTPAPAWAAGDEVVEEVRVQDGTTTSDAPHALSDAERVQALEDRLEQLETELAQSKQLAADRELPITLGAYLDFGAFLPVGNGVGFIEDYGNKYFPEYAGKYAWVFLGDILGSPINSRGEAADLGDAPGVARFDGVHSRGRPGFIANELNLNLKASLGSSIRVRASVDFMPRSGQNFSLGDFFDLDVAEVEWILSDEIPTSVFVGKIDPAFGIEYKDRKAPSRLGITPSLIARYTTGTQLGLKLRTKLLHDWVILAAAVTNGSSVVEQFHFYDEVDSNYGKTLTGRAAVAFQLPSLASNVFSSPLEIGFSGEWGAQDHALDSRDAMVFFGPDLEYRGVDFTMKAQLLFGNAPGRAEDRAFMLDLKVGGYLELGYLISSVFGVSGRVDLRNAMVGLGDERLYVTRTWRLTLGARAAVSKHLIVKVEGLKNFEYGGIPSIDNDMVTSSLLVLF